MITATVTYPNNPPLVVNVNWRGAHLTLAAIDAMLDVVPGAEIEWSGSFATSITWGVCPACESLNVVPLRFDIRDSNGDAPEYSVTSYDDGEPWRGEHAGYRTYPYATTACAKHADEAAQSYFEYTHDC